MEIIELNFNCFVKNIPEIDKKFSYSSTLYENLKTLCDYYRPRLPSIDYKIFLDTDLVITLGTLHSYGDNSCTYLELNNLIGDSFMHIAGCLGIPMLSVVLPEKEGKFITNYETHTLAFYDNLITLLDKYLLNKNSKVILAIVDGSKTHAHSFYNLHQKIKKYLETKNV